MISRCRATIEPGTPDVRDGRDNYVGLGGKCVACADPLYVGLWGSGRPSLAGRGTNFLVGGVRSAGGWQRRFSWDGPPYAGDRDASPTRGEAPVGLVYHRHV